MTFISCSDWCRVLITTVCEVLFTSEQILQKDKQSNMLILYLYTHYFVKAIFLFASCKSDIVRMSKHKTFIRFKQSDNQILTNLWITGNCIFRSKAKKHFYDKNVIDSKINPLKC